MVATLTKPLQLSHKEIDFYDENGFLRLQGVFTRPEIDELSEELDYAIEKYATRGKGWSGPWRQQIMNPEEEAQSVLVALHEIQVFAASWMRAIIKPRLVESLADILGPAVEFHHSTLHAKGPDFGAPFPMHQDYPFYPHSDGRYIDAILHVDGADEDGGCLKFLAGSHKQGPLEHSREGSPHLDQTVYRLDDAVACPAEPGDVVFFSINTIHGSSLNKKPRWRRVMRLGYRDPNNLQTSGQGYGRPGIMVYGTRPKIGDEKVNVYGDAKLNPAINAEVRPSEATMGSGKQKIDAYGNWGEKARPIKDDD